VRSCSSSGLGTRRWDSNAEELHRRGGGRRAVAEAVWVRGRCRKVEREGSRVLRSELHCSEGLVGIPYALDTHRCCDAVFCLLSVKPAD
jgi:hypothetical protein